jgi:hypothetical protein
MVCKFCSGVLFIANLAHNLNLRAIPLNMIVKLSSSQVLEFFSVADVTSEFRA